MIKHFQKALTSIIFALIAVGMVGFTLRAIPDLPDYHYASIVNMAEPDNGYTWDAHVKALTNLSWINGVANIPLLPWPAVAPVNFVLTSIVKRFYIKSHIEYCGKKMVRAIMLQWRPN